MQLVEKHFISKNHPFFDEIDGLAFQGKNLYNSLLYLSRQYYKENEKYIGASRLYVQGTNLPIWDDCKLPKKVCNQMVFVLDTNYKAYFAALRAFKIDPTNFISMPKPPKYKDSAKGRMLLIYPKDALSRKSFIKDGTIKLSQTNIEIQTKIKDFGNIRQVRIVPRNGAYVIEVVYQRVEAAPRTEGIIASIDLGLNNLATVAFSDQQNPFILNGKPLKSINQFYNKEKAKAQGKFPTGIFKSNKIEKLNIKRINKINDYLHKASAYLVNQLVSKSVKTLVIGYNAGWKQEINIGSKNNQDFVQIPFYRFIQMIEYKCRLNGIQTIRQEESYTSKCSFLDDEIIEKHEEYAGRRIKRGLFKSRDGIAINADLNGAYNIMRKAVAGFKAIEGVAVHPRLVRALR